MGETIAMCGRFHTGNICAGYETDLHRKISLSAILKPESQICSMNRIYAGSFSGKQILDSGVLAQALKAEGYRAIDIEDLK